MVTKEDHACLDRIYRLIQAYRIGAATRDELLKLLLRYWQRLESLDLAWMEAFYEQLRNLSRNLDRPERTDGVEEEALEYWRYNQTVAILEFLVVFPGALRSTPATARTEQNPRCAAEQEEENDA